MESRLIPGPRPMPVLGVRGNFVRFMVDAVGGLQSLHDHYGDIASLAQGSSRYVFVFAPAYNEVVLSDTDLFHNLDAGSSPVRMPDNSSLSRLYAGLTNLNGPVHRRQRRLMGSALHRRDVEGYAHDIVGITQRHVARWSVGDEMDGLAQMRALTLAVAVKTLLGLDPGRDDGDVSRLLQNWMDAVFSVPAMALPLDLPGLPYHRLMVLSRRLEGVIRQIIAQRRAARPTGDVLSRLTKTDDDNGMALTDDELIGQTAFLFMAGHATTASALTWTLLLLCANPKVQRDLCDELDEKLHGCAPDVAQLGELGLLERVIKESLRLLPPVMWWGRVSTGPFELGPYRLGAGTNVVYSSYITHRLPELYPQPRSFLPERWLTIDPGPYEYLPFSGGPRTCLGHGFAMMEMKLVLAVVLQRWQVALKAGRRIDRGGLMVSQPKHGLPMVLRPPNGLLERTGIRGNVRSIVDLE